MDHKFPQLLLEIMGVKKDYVNNSLSLYSEKIILQNIGKHTTQNKYLTFKGFGIIFKNFLPCSV